MSTAQEHSNIEIIADMLRVGENKTGKAEIAYIADMNYKQMQKYLEYLINQGYVNKVNLDDTMIAYQVTETGLRFLKAIDNLLDMIKNTKIPEQQPE